MSGWGNSGGGGGGQRQKAGGVFFERRPGGKTDFGGHVELDAEVLDSVKAQLKEGVEWPKVTVLGWKNQSKDGKRYIGLRAIPFSEDEQQGQRRGPPRGRGGGQSYSRGRDQRQDSWGGGGGGGGRQQPAKRDESYDSNDLDEIPF